MAKAIKQQIEYLRSSNFLRTWHVRRGEVCDIDGVALSMNRPAPRLQHGLAKDMPAKSKEPVANTHRKSDDPYLNLLNAAFDAADAVDRFSKWLKTPPPPPPPPPPPSAITASEALKVPPFDLQDVPKAMLKLGMPMAAKLQERWFAGSANYSNDADDLKNEINQDGASYAPTMVDMTTVKMEWVLSFRRAKAAFDDLVQTKVRTLPALNALKEILSRHRSRHDIIGWNFAKSNFLEFHRGFQFQFMKVNATWGQRLSEFLTRAVTAQGVPDDLTGALGAFDLYAAVGYAYFEGSSSSRIAVVTEIIVYVRDSYDFLNDQYLGHWSSSHVAVVPAHQLAEGSGYFSDPVVEGSPYHKGDVMYPVTNRDYREWRKKHGRGGDFIIYTDRVNVKLSPPHPCGAVMASRFARGLGKALTRCAVFLIAMAAIVCLYDYAMQARMRMSEVSSCKWNLVPGTLETPYVARFCYLTRDTVLLRIHDSQGQRLLAERTYLNLGLARFHWTPGELNYDTSTGESISLPPSRLDGWRARLP